MKSLNDWKDEFNNISDDLDNCFNCLFYWRCLDPLHPDYDRCYLTKLPVVEGGWIGCDKYRRSN